MIHPAYLMDVLEKLVEGEIPNQISVPKDIQDGSLLALERMLSIKK
jgi:quinolinate synthase